MPRRRLSNGDWRCCKAYEKAAGPQYQQGVMERLMTSVVIYPSYACNLACSYCWVRGMGLRDGNLHPLKDWASALKDLGQRDTVDIVGGEPSLHKDLWQFCESLPCQVGITTNLTQLDTWVDFVANPLRNVVSITCSWHNAMPREDFLKRLCALQLAGYNVSWSYVSPGEDDPKIVGFRRNINQLIDREPKTVPERLCNAGLAHVVIGAEGEIWRCQTKMMVGERPFANLFKGGWKTLTKTEPCDLDCVPCYKTGQFGVRQ